MTDEHAAAEPTSPVSRGRLEMLYDGIFAIAMTILVLELKPPNALADRRSVAELAHALAHDLPTFGSYLLSFGMLGVLWYRHNVFYRHVRRITLPMLVLHFVQLAAAAFFPFCAALLGRFAGNPLPMAFYSGCIMVYLWAALANLVVARRADAFASELDDATYAKIRTRTIRGATILTAFFAYSLIQALVL